MRDRLTVEHQIEVVWLRGLELNAIDPDDDFFLIGGHSVIAMRIVAELQNGGMPVELRDIFEARTVRGVAARVIERQHALTDQPEGH